MPAPIKARTVVSTIADGAALGSVVDLMDAEVAGIVIDALWDSGDHLAFKVCATYGGTYVALYTSGVALLTYAVAASLAYSGAAISAALAPWRFVKAWSQNGSGTDAAQTGGSLVTFVLK